MQTSLSVAFLINHPALENHQNIRNCCFCK